MCILQGPVWPSSKLAGMKYVVFLSFLALLGCATHYPAYRLNIDSSSIHRFPENDTIIVITDVLFSYAGTTCTTHHQELGHLLGLSESGDTIRALLPCDTTQYTTGPLRIMGTDVDNPNPLVHPLGVGSIEYAKFIYGEYYTFIGKVVK